MSETPKKPAARATFSFGGIAEVMGLVLWTATVAGFLARCWWVLELTSHFRLHLAAGFAVLTLIWLMKRRWKMATYCGAGLALNALLVLLVFWPAGNPVAGTGARLKLVSLNVHTRNIRSDLVLNYLKSADADVVLLMEVDAAWMESLKPLRATYPQVIAQPREDNFGIALFSRLSLTHSEVIELGDAEVPSIATTLVLGGREVFLLGTHPLPPGSAEYAQSRNHQLKAIAAWARGHPGDVIVAGDLNCTPWSPYFGALLRDGGLKSDAPHRGLFSSWPAWLPWLRIPLDHCLVTPNITVTGKRMGPPVGSDHLPLFIELQL
jgi:endonuclease/exonuclease/phosphatase (EEP) superfamily protein YafD